MSSLETIMPDVVETGSKVFARPQDDNPRCTFRRLLAGMFLCLGATFVGCTAISSPISGVPAHRLPPQFLTYSRNNLIPIDISRLRQEPPRQYLVDAGDILGIYIEGVLGKPDEAPPVHMPDRNSDLPPAIGFPMPVREDGTLALPLVPPLAVRGLTLAQIENMIRKSYTIDQHILQEGKDRIIVTLMKERTYRIVVMRQDGIAQTPIGMQSGRGGVFGSEFSTRGTTVNLPAYKNDVLNALAETGGLPGVNAKNEVKILRSSLLDARKRDEFVRAFYAQNCADPCLCHPPLPDDPAIVRIPLRLPPGEIPNFRPDDIILNDGDLVLIESRETEVFYTGGLLGGGQYPLPRDYDLDILGAISIAGAGLGGIGGNRNGGNGSFGGINAQSVGGVPPGQLFILRRTPCNGQITIAVDLARAARDPNARPIVQPGDILILQYKPGEELLNFGLGTFFTFGISQLFSNNN